MAKIKLDERPQSIVAFLGSRVHDTLESTREVCSADVNGDGVVTQQISRCFSASANRILGIPLVSMAMMLSARLPLQPCWQLGAVSLNLDGFENRAYACCVERPRRDLSKVR